ncbi:hypothetical protein GGI13_000021 [Coemansia sp. RSA 455]|nr:hypothetical protein GGI13_000021 [Coemansia sp. RSA 455]
MNRGQAESAKLKHAILAEQTSQCYDDAPNISIRAGQEVASWNSGNVETCAKSESRWATYADDAEEASARLEDDTHDLDQFSRVVVGRVEQSETNKQVTTGTKQRKPPAPRVVSRIASATLASNQLPSARHMPYKRPDSQTSTLARDKPSFSQALASIAQRGSSAKLPAVTTASNNHSLEVVAASNSRSVQSDKVETQDMGENASASRWNHFNSDESDADSEDSQS